MVPGSVIKRLVSAMSVTHSKAHSKKCRWQDNDCDGQTDEITGPAICGLEPAPTPLKGDHATPRLGRPMNFVMAWTMIVMAKLTRSRTWEPTYAVLGNVRRFSRLY